MTRRGKRITGSETRAAGNERRRRSSRQTCIDRAAASLHARCIDCGGLEQDISLYTSSAAPDRLILLVIDVFYESLLHVERARTNSQTALRNPDRTLMVHPLLSSSPPLGLIVPPLTTNLPASQPRGLAVDPVSVLFSSCS